MEVHLRPEQEAFLDQTIRHGRFQSVDEALQEAVALLERENAPTGRSLHGSMRRPAGIEDLIAAFQGCPAPDLEMEFEPVASPVREPAF